MNIFKKVAIVVTGLLMLPIAFNAPSYAADEDFITIGTGGITGVYYPVGGAICRLVNKNRKEHGLRCTVESTGASVFNANAIGAGDLTMGIVQSDTQYYAYEGKEGFAKANKDLRVLFSLYAEAFTLVARDDAKINSFKDLVGKRVNIGDPGSGNRSTMLLLMNEYKFTPKTFSLATDLKPAEMAGALCDNKIDAYVYVVGHPNGSIKEAATTCNSHVVPVEGAEVDTFLKKYAFYPKATIPAGMYKGTDKNVNTFGPRATIMASSKLSDTVAYETVKAVFENFDEFKKLHPALETLTKEEMLTGNTAPFHPGAIKYFKEAGLMK
ncbi:MAG: TAXI family TRAP transporter solute-binding subunit [Deferribacteraceae bacterium]|jgi:TRAP transporter TAXI family solute receptor|nr:TAXI family TRAP transporter solute-binding subunit [Deferribacteraceae bacterium]